MSLNDRNIELIACKRSHPKYQEIRDRHYVENKGTHGQQIHHLAFLDGELVGILTGSSAVWAVKARDDFFGISTKNRKNELNSIVNNSVFRLETHIPHLGSKIISLWRKKISIQWEGLYGVPVAGYETFVLEEGERKGILYKADNWTYVGDTKGSTKSHSGLKNKSKRRKTPIKRVYCYKNGGVPLCNEYKSSWRAETKEEKERAKKLKRNRQEMYEKSYKRLNELGY